MKLKNFASGALFASALAVGSLVSGCATGNGEGGAQAAIQAGSNQQNAVSQRAIQILLLNDFGATPAPVSNSQNQVALDGNVPALNGINLTRPTVSTIPDPQGATLPIPPSTVHAANMTLTVNDRGVFRPSGTATNISSNQNPNGIVTSTVVWTAITPDRVFAYEISGVQTYGQAVNVSAPLNLTALNSTAQALIGPGGTGDIAGNTTVLASATQAAAAVMRFSFFGNNQITPARVREAGQFTTVPDPAPGLVFPQNGQTFHHAVVHPGGNFLYVFGDIYDEGTNLANFGVAQPPANDTVVYDISNPGTNPTTSPVVEGDLVNGPSNVTYRARSLASGRRRFQRGGVNVYSINRSTSRLTLIQTARLPLGISEPKFAFFGPNGADLFVSAYSVNAAAANNNAGFGVPDSGALLRYRLGTSTIQNNQGALTVFSGFLDATNSANSATPAQTFIVPRGALGMAFSQGFRELYLACQLDRFDLLNGLGGNFFPLNVGSIAAFNYDVNSGTLTRRADLDRSSATDTGICYPAFIAAHPTLNFIYVSNNNGLLNLQTNVGQARSRNGLLVNGPSVSTFLVSDAPGTRGQLTRGADSQNDIVFQDAFNSLNVDPSGSLLFVQSSSAILPYDLAASSPGANNIPEAQVNRRGTVSAYAISTQGNGGLELLQSVFNSTGGNSPQYPVSADYYQLLPQAPTQ